MNYKNLLSLVWMSAYVAGIQAQQVAHFDMSLLSGDRIAESVSNQTFPVTSCLPATTVEGMNGDALRFDGYSNFVKAALPINSFSTEALTLSIVLAAESYPMMVVDVAETTPTYATVCGNLDETAKRGFALQLSSQGDLRLQLMVNYGGGYRLEVKGNQKLERGCWNRIDMVFDKTGNKVTLYLNGNDIGSSRVNRCDLLTGGSDFYIGKDATEQKAYGLFFVNTFCGAIDDIAFTNAALSGDEVRAMTEAFASTHPADFNYPAERYAASIWRPQFHAMPSGSWTNESHGMLFSDGRYHVFFQKNANGPYMSRLHWGHISSDNLYDWRDEPIAVYPGESFDIKGCWSGCVYEDGGTPYLLYTGVDNAKARIVQAKAADASLNQWGEKKVIIDGRPSGLSDDFRDPYYFEAGGQKYIIVGTSKNGIGACTLHRYMNGAWTNTGALFFQGNSQNQHGTFWEMPNVTPMGGGKYLFTCTPLNTGVGVRTLCWVGTINSDGTFSPDGPGVQYLEMGGISRDGYGLLSPTIFQKDGKTLLLGIVPDKLPTQTNYGMGWAHNFSLPREVSLSADGTLVQKPYSGLDIMRTDVNFSQRMTLSGTQSLAPVCGRQIELLGSFAASSGTFGFNFLKNGSEQASLSYNTELNKLTLDLTALQRTANDNGVYNGIYAASLPVKPQANETLTLHVFLDGSIADIFVNEKWAFSVRLFPTDAEAIGVEAFSTASTEADIWAWTLDHKQTADAICEIQSSKFGIQNDGENVNCKLSNGEWYDLSGRQIVNSKSSNSKLPQGLYIRDGRVIVHNP